jgi:PAS domain S-box-containing protein
MIKNLLQALLDNSPDYIFFKDKESRFIKTNKAHAQLLLGLADPEEAVGKTDFDLFPGQEEDAQRFYEEEQQIMKTGEGIIHREWQVPSTATGEIVWLAEHKLPLRDDETGEIVGLIGFGRDVTERKQAELAREKLTLQLQTAAEVGRAATSILDPQELTQQIVDLIRERFELYYVGLFLVEKIVTLQESGTFAILRAATGEAGKKMLAQKYKLKVDNASMIGRCIEDGKAVISGGEENPISVNSFLPEIRTELALPLISRGETIGALYIQTSQEIAFTEDDLTVFQLMTDQLATAIENARLFQQVEEELEKVKDDLYRHIRVGWSKFLGDNK